MSFSLKRHIVLLLTLLSFFPLLADSDGSSWWNTDYNTTEGTEFWVTFMDNYGKHVQDEDLSLTIYATARNSANVVVSGTWTDPITHTSTSWSKSFIVHEGGVDSIFIPNQVAYLQESNQTTNAEWLNKGIKITSDKPISLYSHNANVDSYDASLILPTQGLNKEYVIQTFSVDNQATEFAIVSASANNNITINLRETRSNNITTTTNLSFTLEEGQTYCYRPADRLISLTGTTICATEPIAVFQGGQHAKIPANIDPASHIYHQVFPIDFWGKMYIATRSSNNAIDIIRITALKNDTKVFKEGTLVATLNALETYEDMISWQEDEKAKLYTSSNPTECYLYASKRNSDFGSPAMTPIVPTELGVRSTILATFHETNVTELGFPDDGQDTINKYYKHYANVVTKTSIVNGMQIDDNSIGNLFSAVPNTDYSVAIIDISDGSHRLTNNLGTFISRVYGIYSYAGDDYRYEQSISYAYSGGSRTNRSVDLLINDEYTRGIDVCINEDPVKFSAVINFDYDEITWISKLEGNSTPVGNKDSIIYYDYHHGGTDSLRLVVRSHTDLCSTIYHYDTIWAQINVHDTAHIDFQYGDNTFRTLCYGEHFSVNYKDPDEVSREHSFIADTSTLQNFQGQNIRFQLNLEYVAKDSFKTSWGCDSVIWQRFIIRPTYEYTIYDTICVNDLPYSWRDGTDHELASLNLSDAERAALILTDSAKSAYTTKQTTCDKTFKTIYDCDSILHLHLTVLPIYHLIEKDTVCVDSINPYIWNAHSMSRVFNSSGKKVSSIPLNRSGIYIYRDSLKTHSCKSCELAQNCDSIWTLELTVLDRHIKETQCNICSNESYKWEDTLWIGWNAPIPETDKYKRVFSTDTVLYHAFKTKDIYECDSIIIHRLHICNANTIPADTTRIDICEDESYYFESKNKTYQWSTPDGVVSKFVLTDTIKTINPCYDNHRCDSSIVHLVYVHPTYLFEEKDTICANGSLSWHGQDISGLSPGTYIYWDSLTTNAYGCDSVYKVTLLVTPTYFIEESYRMCDADAYTWTGHLNDTTFHNIPEGVYIIYDSLLTETFGCDSVHRLTLRVDSTYHHHIEASICDNESYDYMGHVFSGLSEGDYPFDTLLMSVHSCDSLMTLTLHVHPTYLFEEKDTICENGSLSWHGQDISGLSPGTYIYWDSLTTNAYGCDSVYKVTLLVTPTYHYHDTLTICENDTISWQGALYVGSKYESFGRSYDAALYDSIRTDITSGTYTSFRHYETVQHCDSNYYLVLNVLPTYYTEQERELCQENYGYYEAMNNGSGGVVPTDVATDIVYYDTISAYNGCDSVIKMTYHIWPIYRYYQDTIVCQDRDNHNWVWTDEFGAEHITPQPISIASVGEQTLADTLPTMHGCDSIFTIKITVTPSYYYYDTIAICEIDTIHWQDSVIAGAKYSGDYALELRDIRPAGQYGYSINYGTKIYGCDSVYNLHLVITPAFLTVDFEDTTIVHICDNESYRFKTADTDTVYNNVVRDWVTGNKSIGRHVLTGWDTTRLGCDSAVAHVVYVHPTYQYYQDTIVCQNTINTAWEWTDEFGNLHAVPISLYSAGDFTYVDTLKTETCTDCRNGIGCDSIFYINIHIPPIYRFDSTYAICENEHLTWQGRSYAGDSAQAVSGDKILTVGLHYDTVQYTTREGCDSIYYMQVRVNPIYDTIGYVIICDNEDYIWYQKDRFGQYHDLIWTRHIDTAYLGVDEALLPQPAKDTIMLYKDRMLSTINNCDSMSRLRITIQPSYFFVTDTTICTSDRLRWRGKNYAANDTVIEERLLTSGGCDSIYQLRLHTMPSYLFPLYREICDNETLYHRGSTHVMWEPGMIVPEPDDCNGLFYRTVQGCDSLYCYYITIDPTYLFEDTLDMCSGERYLFHDTRTLCYDRVYPIGKYVPPIDTMFTDSFTTVNGCDSVYVRCATVYPSYRHIDNATICDNDSLVWRGKIYKGYNLVPDGLTAGNYVFFDSLLTEHGCDSVYVLYVKVNSTYFFEQHEYICDLDYYDFNGRIINGVAGEYFYTDSLLSVNGCDSVYHLYLTIYPSTEEILYDTLCAGETYYFHNKPLTESGYYVDTTLNEYGCRHITHLYLTIENPTEIELHFTDLCAEEKFIDIHYSYKGRTPISYSVHFDDFAHSQRFVDMDNVPLENDSTIRIYIPYGDPLPNPKCNPEFLRTGHDCYEYLDTTHLDYPRPGRYGFTVYLQNGVCAEDRIRVDTALVMKFPAWIHEQHWNDAIVLFNDIYNGGYVFDAYQWYRQDDEQSASQPIPGEVQEYIYDPQLLHFGAEYCVHLHVVSVKGEPTDEWHFTCPIVPTLMFDTIVPQKEYYSVVPTYVPRGLDGVDILCTEGGTYCVTATDGRLILPWQVILPENDFAPHANNAHHVTLPQISGVYYFHLMTEQGYHRVIRVIHQ